MNWRRDNLRFPSHIVDVTLTIFFFARGWLIAFTCLFLNPFLRRKCFSSPILIVGPGRSGTTLLRKYIQDNCYAYSPAEQSHLFTYTALAQSLCDSRLAPKCLRLFILESYLTFLFSRLESTYSLYLKSQGSSTNPFLMSNSFKFIRSTLKNSEQNNSYSAFRSYSYVIAEIVETTLKKNNPYIDFQGIPKLKVFDKTPIAIFNLPSLVLSACCHPKFIYTIRPAIDVIVSSYNSQSGRSPYALAIRCILSTLNILVIVLVFNRDSSRASILFFSLNRMKGTKSNISQYELDMIASFLGLSVRKNKIESLKYYHSTLLGDSDLKHHANAIYSNSERPELYTSQSQIYSKYPLLKILVPLSSLLENFLSRLVRFERDHSFALLK